MLDSEAIHLLDRLPRSRLAEGPFWDDEARVLLWVDIAGHAIHRYDPETASGATHTVSGAIGFAVPTSDGRLVAGIAGGLYELAFGTAAETVLVRPDMHAENRFNDGKCDPRGRLWAGTMHKDATSDRKPTGALYRWRHGSLEVVETDVSLSNGLGWSPSGDTMYFSDTHRGTIWAYDYDIASGAVANRRPFATVPLDLGVPDGLTVDSVGRVFVAIWRAGRLNVYAPSGTLEATIPVPVRNPTSCCFGGADLKTLFITTMPATNEADPRSGSLFAIGRDTAGQKSVRMDRSL